MVNVDILRMIPPANSLEFGLSQKESYKSVWLEKEA